MSHSQAPVRTGRIPLTFARITREYLGVPAAEGVFGDYRLLSQMGDMVQGEGGKKETVRVLWTHSENAAGPLEMA